MRTLIAASMIAVLAGAPMAVAAPKQAPVAAHQKTTKAPTEQPAAQKAPAPTKFKWHHRNQFTG